MGRRLCVFVLLLFACSPSADEIRREIAAANYCAEASECQLVSGRCPFGCYVLVNQAEAERIQSLMQDYESNCQYDCVPPPERLVCEQGVCIASELTDEEVVQQQIDDANYCESAEDCEYVGSVCPFGCAIYVNKAEAASVRTALENYQSTCDYDCAAETGVECEASMCVAQFDESE